MAIVRESMNSRKAPIKGLGLAISPNDPGFKSKLPPPAQLGDGTDDNPQPLPGEGVVRLPGASTPVAPVNGFSTTANAAPTGSRIVISYGRRPGMLVAAVERAPNWDIERSYGISEEALLEVLPLLKELAKIKDLTGDLIAERFATPERPAPFPHDAVDQAAAGGAEQPASEG